MIWKSLYIYILLDSSPFLDSWFVYIFSQSGACLIIFITVLSFEEKRFSYKLKFQLGDFQKIDEIQFMFSPYFVLFVMFLKFLRQVTKISLLFSSRHSIVLTLTFLVYDPFCVNVCVSCEVEKGFLFCFIVVVFL